MERLKDRLRPNSMFSRVMVLFTVVILASMGFLSMVFYISMRSDRIEGRMEELKNHGEEIAYLAEKRYEYKMKSQAATLVIVGKAAGIASETVDEYVKWKASTIAREIDAHVAIVDVFGKDEFIPISSMQEDKMEQIRQTFTSLLTQMQNGETVIQKVQLNGTPKESGYVVAVPWMTGTSIRGAVFLYTSAKEIRSTYSSIVWQILGVAVGAFVVAIVSAYIFTKQMTKPLASMVKATEAMAKGDFEQKAEVEGSQEIQRLAASFNTMAQQLEQLEKSRREFVANVSHELRSPMTSIHGFIQGMIDGTIPQEEHDKYLKIVSEETTRLTKLINDLLQLSSMEQAKPRIHESCFDINELIRRVLVRRYTDVEQKEIEVEVQFETESCICIGDSDAIEQVVVNLLDNAIKFTPENGTIWIGSKTEKDQTLIWVEDDGQEIPQEDLSRIFDRFYKGDKAHTSGKGTGLGLSISKRIIDDHRQKIWAESSGGKTSFFFTLVREKAENKEKK